MMLKVSFHPFKIGPLKVAVGEAVRGVSGPVGYTALVMVLTGPFYVLALLFL